MTDRPEMHNPSVDEYVASRGACGQVHLPTGRTCLLHHHHQGSCAFTTRDEIPARLPLVERRP
jgi:hypothetical protein